MNLKDICNFAKLAKPLSDLLLKKKLGKKRGKKGQANQLHGKQVKLMWIPEALSLIKHSN